MVRTFVDAARDGDRIFRFDTRRKLMQILDKSADVDGMVMLDIRPALLTYGMGATPVFPEHKTELAMCIDLPRRLRYACGMYMCAWCSC